MSSLAHRVENDAIDVFSVWETLWAGRWVVAAVAVIFASLSIAYALLATEWFQADVVISPTDKKSSSNGLGGLSGLASLAGVSSAGLGGGGGQEPYAVLKSKGFARQFITDEGLTLVLFNQGGWFDNHKDIRDAVRIFEDKVRSIDQDKKTGLVTVTMTWTDAAVAANWANSYVKRLNARLRDEAIRESERNLAYLSKEIAATPMVAVQQSLGRVVESEMQKMLLARGSEEFAFKVIDPATPPNRRYSPRRSLIVIISTLAGALLGALFVLARNAYRHRQSMGLV